MPFKSYLFISNNHIFIFLTVFEHALLALKLNSVSTCTLYLLSNRLPVWASKLFVTFDNFG